MGRPVSGCARERLAIYRLVVLRARVVEGKINAHLGQETFELVIEGVVGAQSAKLEQEARNVRRRIFGQDLLCSLEESIGGEACALREARE